MYAYNAIIEAQLLICLNVFLKAYFPVCNILSEHPVIPKWASYGMHCLFYITVIMHKMSVLWQRFLYVLYVLKFSFSPITFVYG